MNESWVPDPEWSKDMSRGKARKELEAIEDQMCIAALDKAAAEIKAESAMMSNMKEFFLELKKLAELHNNYSYVEMFPDFVSRCVDDVLSGKDIAEITQSLKIYYKQLDV